MPLYIFGFGLLSLCALVWMDYINLRLSSLFVSRVYKSQLILSDDVFISDTNYCPFLSCL